jgi:hypothetical protein
MDDEENAASAGRARNLANGRASALPRAPGVQRVEVGWRRVYTARDSSLLERGPGPSLESQRAVHRWRFEASERLDSTASIAVPNENSACKRSGGSA